MRKKLLIIGGPSGVGKTKLSIIISKLYNGEVISCDSMQIYKDFDIGTAKIKDSEKNGVVHHLIDIKNFDEEFSVSEYKTEAEKIIDNLNKSNKLPILVGGTGLYINAILYDYEFRKTNKNSDLRFYYEKLSSKYGNMVLCNILKGRNIDFSGIHLNDTKRLIRLIETNGNSNEEKEKISNYDFLYICLNQNRDKLYQKLNERVDAMFKEGLPIEVDNLLQKGVPWDCQPMQSIGYKEFKGFYEGKINLAEVNELIKLNTRHYAKRQLTWFRNSQNIIMYDVENGFDDLIKIIGEWLNK
ncbi:MAG: tRNA (adenosine(37)-N6)-dimethylallyltransferase MiaA [Clostridia bacterium]|nr:tRNA (adenosine(37)-N6)-dimethylallyltransferase MiaA [Clostridia bacterium]